MYQNGFVLGRLPDGGLNLLRRMGVVFLAVGHNDQGVEHFRTVFGETFQPMNHGVKDVGAAVCRHGFGGAADHIGLHGEIGEALHGAVEQNHTQPGVSAHGFGHADDGGPGILDGTALHTAGHVAAEQHVGGAVLHLLQAIF